MPFVTEEIWQAVAPVAGRAGPTIMLQPYPKTIEFERDEASEREIAPVKATILGARQIRGQLDVPRSRQMPIYVKAPSPADSQVIQGNAELIKFLANVTEINFIDAEGGLPPTAMQLVEGYVVHAPLSSLIDDPDAELARLAKRKVKTEQQAAAEERKLGNQSFVANAPAEIVAEVRARIDDFKAQIAQLEEQERRVGMLKKAAK
jgi:valyl-tRNA synthetase